MDMGEGTRRTIGTKGIIGMQKDHRSSSSGLTGGSTQKVVNKWGQAKSILTINAPEIV